MPNFNAEPPQESTLPPLEEPKVRVVNEALIDECVQEGFKDLFAALVKGAAKDKKAATQNFTKGLQGLLDARSIAITVTQ